MSIKKVICSRCKKPKSLDCFNSSGMGYCGSCREIYYKERIKDKVKPVFKIDKFRNLSDMEIIKILGVKTQKNIAIEFGVSVSQVSLEISKRNLFSALRYNKILNYNNSEILKQPDTTKELNLSSKGCWMKSKERVSFVNSGQMKNKSLKYN